MKISWKWWIGFTIVMALIISTITTFNLYDCINRSLLFCMGASIIFVIIAYAMRDFELHKAIILSISLIIFCSSNFIITTQENIFLILHEKDKPPTVMTGVFVIKLPYTYDITWFTKTQRLTIGHNNKIATIKFELSGNESNLLMLQHGFAGQKEFNQEIQKLGNNKKYVDTKLLNFGLGKKEINEHLEIFEFYGLKWKTFEISQIEKVYNK